MTKKRVTGRKNQEARPDFGNAARPENAEASHLASTETCSAHKTPPPISTQDLESLHKQPPKQSHAQGSASKRKQRKLAVNFDAAKVTDWSAKEFRPFLQLFFMFFPGFTVDNF